MLVRLGLWMRVCVEEERLIWASRRSVARVLLAYFKGLKRDDVADLDVPLGMLYVLEPVRIYSQHIWTQFNAGNRSLMALSSGPIDTTNPEIGFWTYATISYGGQRLISRIKVPGTVHSGRGLSAL